MYQEGWDLRHTAETKLWRAEPGKPIVQPAKSGAACGPVSPEKWDSRTGNILRKMTNTLEQRKWSWLQEDRRPMMPGVSEQTFRRCRGWDGGVLPSVARFPTLPFTENDCLKRSNPPQTHFDGYFRRNLVT